MDIHATTFAFPTVRLLLPALASGLLASVNLQAQSQQPPTVPAPLYVNHNLATGNDDGTTWEDAFRTTTAAGSALDRAIAAQGAYGSIWVAQSLTGYVPSNPATGFLIQKPLQLYGGFIGGETSVHARKGSYVRTILEGANTRKHVVSITPPTQGWIVIPGASPGIVIDGFQITRGNGSLPGEVGGGILCLSFDLDLANCFVWQNQAHDQGGGLWFLGGGGIGPDVPAYHHLRIKNSEFTGNATDYEGGAIYARIVTGEIVNTSFRSNAALLHGGAVLLRDMLTENRLDFTNCVFQWNATNDTGGNDKGGAICLQQQGYALLVNCTLADNATINENGGPAVFIGSASAAEIYNSILYFNRTGSSNPPAQIFPGAFVQYSDVENLVGGLGNIDADPLFVRRSLGNLRLKNLPAMGEVSPCIDAADYSRLPPDNLDANGDGIVTQIFPIDLDGLGRLTDVPAVTDQGVGSTGPMGCPTCTYLDMGAYEVP